jgi:hypothetical protein
MKGQSAEDYATALTSGLSQISKYDIKIGSVVCDGNKAQKKAFSPTWDRSIFNRSTLTFIKHVIFIPCLCHRINNSYKSAATKSEVLPHIRTTQH